MGTRNLTMVIHKEETKIAQYGQWDGYPKGNGVIILNFLKRCDIEKFKKKLANVRFSNEKDDAKVDRYLKSIGCEDGWMNMEQADLYHKKFPYLSRDIGAKILDLVYKSKGKVLLVDQTEFAGESLFCEWAYVIDLDKNQLEVYQGFNTTKLEDGQRFKYLDTEEGKFRPIRCIKTFNLAELPTEEEFIAELEKVTVED